MTPQYLSIAQAAKFLGTSVDTIYRRIAAGHLPAYDISDPDSPKKTIRIAKADVEAMLRPLDAEAVAS